MNAPDFRERFFLEHYYFRFSQDSVQLSTISPKFRGMLFPSVLRELSFLSFKKFYSSVLTSLFKIN